MELMEQDLNQILKSRTNFGEANLIRIVYNSLCSIAFFHEANVMHRDLKPSNLLISPNCDVKVCDFGLSRTIAQENMGVNGHNTLSIREAL